MSFATGGFIPTGDPDRPIAAMLHAGDYIIRPRTTRALSRELLLKLNEIQEKRDDR